RMARAQHRADEIAVPLIGDRRARRRRRNPHRALPEASQCLTGDGPLRIRELFQTVGQPRPPEKEPERQPDPCEQGATEDDLCERRVFEQLSSHHPVPSYLRRPSGASRTRPSLLRIRRVALEVPPETVTFAENFFRGPPRRIRILFDPERPPELIDDVLVGRGDAPADRFLTRRVRTHPVAIDVAPPQARAALRMRGALG